MTKLSEQLPNIRRRLTRLARKHKVPGASLGILKGKQVVEAVTGLTSVDTGVEVTPDTLFQIGSNTKIYTTTMVMQLVDAKQVDLDEPVATYVPEVKRRRAASKITVRHLLTHTSGIEGDHFEDFGRDDDALRRYVKSLRKIGQIHEPGEMWSYCNSGFCLAGRLVEQVTGQHYHEVLRERILEPLGLQRTTVLMEEMLKHRYAVGHLVAPDGDPAVAPRVVMAPAQAPAGSVTSATASDVLAFVRMHLDGGRSPDGKKVLLKRSVQAMQRKQADMPESHHSEGMGLGWMLQRWDGQRVIHHGGGTIGQLSFLYVLPDKPFAVCLLTNSTSGGALWADLGPWLFEELAGVTMPQASTPDGDAPELDLTTYAGTFARLGVEAALAPNDGGLAVTLKGTGPMAELMSEQRFELTPADAERFFVATPTDPIFAVFRDFDRSGRPKYLHIGGRVMRRRDAR